MSGLVGGGATKSGLIGGGWGQGDVPCFAYRTGSDVLMANNATTTFVFSHKWINTHDDWDGTSTFTCSVPGIYHLYFNVSFDDVAFPYSYGWIQTTGASEDPYTSTTGADNQRTAIILGANIKLKIGDTAIFRAYQNTSTAKYMSWSHCGGFLISTSLI